MCDEAEEGDVLLLCDGCNSAFHLACAKPRLRSVPAGELPVPCTCGNQIPMHVQSLLQKLQRR